MLELPTELCQAPASASEMDRLKQAVRSCVPSLMTLKVASTQQSARLDLTSSRKAFANVPVRVECGTEGSPAN
jgi:hypothetical protein